MHINVDLKLTEEQEQIVQERVKNALSEVFFHKDNEIGALIRQCVKGFIKSEINIILQTKDYKEFLTERIKEEICKTTSNGVECVSRCFGVGLREQDKQGTLR